jgi:tRNA 2-selenouridine synthase
MPNPSDQPAPHDTVSIAQWLAMPRSTVFDTRSPAEYAQGHIPGAINLPLFDNEERAEIGTLFKQVGKQAAVDRGLELIGPRLAAFAQHARERAASAADPGAPVLVHCWRGGMRSESVTWLMRMAGIPARKMDGGYKAYRRHLTQALAHPWWLRVLAGPTGTGKTPILRHLAELGEQVLDLEALADHLGSAFGNLDGHAQPTSEQFANDCFDVLRGMDGERVVWLEDESRRIGTVHMPEPLYATLRKAPITLIDRTRAERLDEIERIYGSAPIAPLQAAFRRITDKLGGQHAQAALAALDRGAIREAADIGLVYYDKLYAHTLDRHDRLIAHKIDGRAKTFLDIARELRDL